MNRWPHAYYDPRYGYPWVYLPQQLQKDSKVRGRRPTNQSTADLHPIAPIHPFPPDPYINQFRPSEALQTGTLFMWLHASEKNGQESSEKEDSETEDLETSAAEESSPKGGAE
ncbi:hypothetical protein [Brevibacillus centrosporus]|uniref:Uncharacterized protein n=1 Tax=Brevibacillus centrosporus TaxID=54910 RepID=A0A1I3TCQ5_9BACL|nr:hypothetical protein [Brevibacillus centrosporus]SFJ67511.1 hypothetical protein SAMN05518846_104470 [Brevibacillus centrosporus]